MEDARQTGKTMQMGAVIRSTEQEEKRRALTVLGSEVHWSFTTQKAEELPFDN